MEKSEPNKQSAQAYEGSPECEEKFSRNLKSQINKHVYCLCRNEVEMILYKL